MLWFAFIYYTHNTLEDALITYRYAKNIVAGKGFVFNLGEHVLGTTTPLLTILLALAGFVGGPSRIAIISTILMTSCGLVVGLFIYATLKHLGFPSLHSALAAGLFYLFQGIMVTSTGGMETPLVLLLMSASLYLLATERFVQSSIVLALLVLTRIDGLAWAFWIFLAMLIARRSFPTKEIAVFIVVLIPWVAFSVWYFGSPIPHSIVAKMTIGPSSDVARYQELKAYLKWFVGATGFDATAQPLSLWLFLGVIGILALLRKSRRQVLWPLIVFPPTFWLALFLGRAWVGFIWYLIPVSWCAAIVVATGISEFGIMLDEHVRRFGLLRIIPDIVVLCLFGYFSVAFLQTDLGAFRQWHDFQINEDGLRIQVGEWLRDNTPEGSKIAMEAIGYQAYYSDRYVIDLAGLVSPDVVQIRRVSASNADAFNRILTSLHPDYIVLRSVEVDQNQYFEGGLLFESTSQRDYFFSCYEEVKRFSAPDAKSYGETIGHLTVYRRKMDY